MSIEKHCKCVAETLQNYQGVVVFGRYTPARFGVIMRGMARDITPAPKPGKQDHLRVLSNGAIYDMRKKRIVNSKAVTTKITEENAVAMQSRQVELKRAALKRAANAVAAQGGGVDGRAMQGDMAYVEAIGEAMTMKALTVNDPKAVDAARFVFAETGIGERQAEQVPMDALPEIIDALGRLVTDIASRVQLRATANDAIDGEAE